MLDAAQKELLGRYAALAAARKGHGHPVYAIEHGFDHNRVEQLRAAASQELRQAGILDNRWLVWMALAAEAGYRYQGDEYWPEFEYAAGEWRNQYNRNVIRRKFERFSQIYGGPRPVGDWALHFNIIAWPIANAVLPKYLQPHFAEHLFNQRFHLIDAIPRGAEAVGSLLAENYRGASARFDLFLRQVELTGQIVLAMRDHDVSGEQYRISPGLLSRIVSDLGACSRSKHQLQSARQVISTRQANVSASLRPTAAAKAGTNEASPVRDSRLAARLEGSTALIGLIFPDVGEALKQAGLCTSLLASLRIRMPGSGSPWEPGAVLLTDAKRDRALTALPEAGVPLLDLECDNAQLKAALAPFFDSHSRATHLLRRESDGLYRERITRQVRSGSSYLLVRSEPLSAEAERLIGASPCRSMTCGAHVYALELGAHISASQRVALEAIGIGSIVGIEVEPLGLMPRPDEDGTPAWTSAEPVLLGFTADFPCDSFTVVLDSEAPQQVNASDGQGLISIKLLPPGLHHLSVQAVGLSNRSPVGPAAGFDFLIRQTEPWQIAMRGKSGFRLAVDPSNAKLESVFSRHAPVLLIGPAGRSAHWTLNVFDAAGRQQGQFDGGTSKIGASQNVVDELIDRMRRSASDAIDGAHRVDIVVSIGELGRQGLSFENEVAAVRWIYDATTRRVRLIDETDETESLTVYSYALSKPLVSKQLNLEGALNGLAIEPPGALLIARRPGTHASVFVHMPARVRFQAFRDLIPTQSLNTTEPPPQAILKLLRGHIRWSRARAVGPQATLQKEITLGKIYAAIACQACGEEFGALLNNDQLQRAQSFVGGSPGFGLRMKTFEPHENPADDLVRFVELALLYRVANLASECADPFYLAFSPGAFRKLDGPEAIDRVTKAIKNKVLVRGAFLAKAASEQFVIRARTAAR